MVLIAIKPPQSNGKQDPTETPLLWVCQKCLFVVERAIKVSEEQSQ
jgi:hypothetical protein